MAEPQSRRPDECEFEAWVEGFESAWNSQETPDLQRYLDSIASLTPEARLPLLRELVKLDLEFRWRSASPLWLRLEDYLACFPELAVRARLELALIAEEYRVRTRWGDAPAHGEYSRRFPDHGPELAEMLRAVDADLHHDSRQSTSSSRRGTSEGRDELPAPLPYADYRLERQIGAGGMGKVYVATRKSLGQRVAVKVLQKARLGDDRSVLRFLQEARAIAQLSHPNIVGVHGVGRLPDGSYFMVLDHVDGRDLSALLDAEVDPRRAAETVATIAWAIEYSHTQGVIHCDLKPGNVLLDSNGRPMVTDFGLARLVVPDGTWEADEIAGTLSFMAPEQLDSALGPISPRTDVHGLGALLHALLYRCPPYQVGPSEGNAPLRSLMRTAMPAGRVAEWLDHICRKCLAHDPADRFASAAEVAQALCAAEAGA